MQVSIKNYEFKTIKPEFKDDKWVIKHCLEPMNIYDNKNRVSVYEEERNIWI